MSARTLAALLFVVCLAGYVALVLTGHDGDPLMRNAVVLAGVFGVAAQNQSLQAKVDRITQQTNGVLDARIKTGAEIAARRALIAAGINVAPHPADTEAPPAVEKDK